MDNSDFWPMYMEERPEERAVHQSHLFSNVTLALIATLFLALGFILGRLTMVQQLAADHAANAAASSSAAIQDNAGTLPQSDSPGKDVDGLPRYPGSVRIEYREEVVDSLLDTEVEYLVVADLEAVQDFYRTVFDEGGWIVADLGIYQGEWMFFIISGSREAHVELEIEAGLVEIEIEVSEPLPTRTIRSNQ